MFQATKDLIYQILSEYSGSEKSERLWEEALKELNLAETLIDMSRGIVVTSHDVVI